MNYDRQTYWDRVKDQLAYIHRCRRAMDHWFNENVGWRMGRNSPTWPPAGEEAP